MSERGQPDEDKRGNGEDLSVPLWVWTLLGFAFLTAVVIVVIIVGGGSGDTPGAEGMEEVIEETPATLPATMPTTAVSQ